MRPSPYEEICHTVIHIKTFHEESSSAKALSGDFGKTFPNNHNYQEHQQREHFKCRGAKKKTKHSLRRHIRHSQIMCERGRNAGSVINLSIKRNSPRNMSVMFTTD